MSYTTLANSAHPPHKRHALRSAHTSRVREAAAQKPNSSSKSSALRRRASDPKAGATACDLDAADARSRRAAAADAEAQEIAAASELAMRDAARQVEELRATALPSRDAGSRQVGSIVFNW